MNLVITSLIAGSTILATPAAAAGPVDIRLAWRVAGATPEQPAAPAPELAWSTLPPLPAEAVEDLTKLKAAVAAVPIADKAALVSDNGRVIAVFRGARGPDPRTAPGVTIWTDWRKLNSEHVFSDMTTVRFLSNNHVLLSHHPDGGPYVSHVVDLRQPSTRFQFSGYLLDTLRVTDSGKWMAISQNGAACTGELDPNAPTQSVEGTVRPAAAGAKNALWLRDGRYLLVEKDGPRVEVIDSANWTPVSSIPGSLGRSWSEPNLAGQDACIGYKPGLGACVFEVSESGQLSAAQWPYQTEGESTVRISPSGKFAITQKQGPDGFVVRSCRRTGDASEGDVPPSYPTAPARTTFQDIGWLVWQPSK